MSKWSRSWTPHVTEHHEGDCERDAHGQYNQDRPSQSGAARFNSGLNDLIAISFHAGILHGGWKQPDQRQAPDVGKVPPGRITTVSLEYVLIGGSTARITDN